MGLAERVLTREAPAPQEQRALQVLPWGDWSTSSTSMSGSGINVSPESALQLLTVYGCVSLITDTIATMPIDILRDNGNGHSTPVTQKPRWLIQPNPLTTMIDFLSQTITSLLLDGNAYWVWFVDGNGLPNELHVLDPKQVQIKPSGANGSSTPNDTATSVSYFIRGAPFRGRLKHIRGITRPGYLKGLSPIENARQAVGLGLAADEYAARFYSNGASLSGVIETPMNLELEQARELASKWNLNHGGLRNSHKPGVIDNGAHWNPISITPEQAQFLQTREFEAAEICSRLFLLDPSMLGIAINRGQNLTYANLEQRNVHLVQFTLMRWIVRLEKAFSDLLPSVQELKFNVDALKRADLKTRYESYQLALGGQNGTATPWMTSDEVRELEDLEPLPSSELQPPAQAAPPAAPQPAPNGKQPVGAT